MNSNGVGKKIYLHYVVTSHVKQFCSTEWLIYESLIPTY